ncbi:hypothetical protein N7454_010003 [Penicillium verhagenii]|nr:hypothetical protein N7454_010003 [Penicillium verhagenii]
MTARGKNVKTQTLATEVHRYLISKSPHNVPGMLTNGWHCVQTEIFVYDRQYVSESGEIELPVLPAPEPFQPGSPPASLTDQNDLQAWRNLFMARKTWAQGFSSRCGVTDKMIQEHNQRTDVINRAVGVALENLKSHVGNLEHRFQEAQSWASHLLEEQQIALEGWQDALARLESIPARKDFPLLGRPSTPKKDTNRPTGTLNDFVDGNEVLRAGADAAVASPRFAGQMEEIAKTVGKVASDTQRLVDDILSSPAEVDEGLLAEVETIAKKIGTDYEHVLGVPNNQKSLANISRLALNHTQNLLPSLLAAGADLHQSLVYSVRRRSSAEKTALQYMRTISVLQSRLADTHTRLINLDVNTNVFEVIDAVFQLPMVYGSILIESVRRHEWTGKIKADSLNLAEEMAILRDEEQRRRKKWIKSMGDHISFGDSTTLGIEVNLQGQAEEWPEVARKEIETYIEELRSKHSLPKIAEDLSQQFKDLDTPSRQQRRRAKAFKNGSVFDMGRSSMLLRGDDMVRSLQDEKTKLEERVKGSESRIRKLEDLLHRQSHFSRPSSGNFGPDFPSSPASPHPDTLSRRSSVSSRRVSMTQSPEDRALVQRIVSLEAELMTERETVQRLQKEAHTERQTNSDKYQEAQSTKKDLIGNLEARQREFEDERKYLEAEVKKCRLRNEELEEELDKLTDSRDHDKQEAEEQIHQLEAELQSANANAAGETQKIKDLDDRIQQQQEKEQVLQAEVKDLARQNDELSRKDRDNYLAIQSAFMNLSPGGSVPPEIPGIIHAIEILSEGLAIHARSAEDNASKAMAEMKTLEEETNTLRSQLEEKGKFFDDREAEVAKLSEQLSQVRTEMDSTKCELDQERTKLNTLHSQVSAGEVGSDALRERIAEEERKHADLSQRLVDAESKARDLQDKKAEWEKKVEAASEADRDAQTRYEGRVGKCYETSRQLYSQVDKLERMLEQLGFVVIQQEGHIIVQRASKLAASASGLGESLAQSGIVSAKPDSSLLEWMKAVSPEEEDIKFAAFLKSLSRFDVSIFGDVVVKRVKDIEVLARKWQKEARGYREKYHRVQSEAHDKIAYRSFKEGDLALFLPTRNQAIRSWAAFNVGAPHYFLREQDSHKLNSRDWLLARISKIEERVVDLSKSLNGVAPDRHSLGEASEAASFDDENPFELSDGLRWYLLEASEEKPGAPATPGLAKTTVASTPIDAKGSIRLQRTTEENTVAQTLSKSLDSRRNSSHSKRGTPTPSQRANDSTVDLVRPADADADPSGAGFQRESAPIFEEVRRDLLFGP